MKDLFGVTLKCGQRVGFTTRGRYNYTLRGTIIGFTPKMVRVAHRAKFNSNDVSQGETSNLEPQNLVVSTVSQVNC